MTNPRRTKALALAGFLVAMFGFGLAAIPSVAAVSPGGQVNFFDVSGSACTSTAWDGGVFNDGNQGFGGNLGGAQKVPIVANGEEICVEFVLTDQAPNTSYTISSPGGILTLVSGTNPFSTDGSGNADVFMVFSISGLSGDCMTHPIDISPGIAGGAGSAGQIHHVYGGSGACGGQPPGHGVSVPEFPLGAAGFVSVMAAGIAAMLLLRRRQLSI